MTPLERFQRLSGRIEALREMVDFHRRTRADYKGSADWEDAARRFAAAEIAIGDWLTEALSETLTEARLILAELKALGLAPPDASLD